MTRDTGSTTAYHAPFDTIAGAGRTTDPAFLRELDRQKKLREVRANEPFPEPIETRKQKTARLAREAHVRAKLREMRPKLTQQGWPVIDEKALP
jgi:ribosomal protein S21